MIVNAPTTFHGSATLVASPKQIQRVRTTLRTAPAMSVRQRGALRGSHVVFTGARTFSAVPHINGQLADTNERAMSRPFVDRTMRRPFIDRTMTRPATE
jgi:hypothetical protein